MIKIGFIQFRPFLANLDKNIISLDLLIDKAKKADLLVIPELANSGYNFESREQAFGASEPLKKSRFVDFIVSKCRANGQHIVTGFNERDKENIYNSAFLAGPDGLIGKYRKIHLFMNEKDIFTPGNVGVPVFKTGIGNIGVLVCFDYMIPDVWRIASIKGAEIVCHPSNLVTAYPRKVIPALALMNRVFIITANRIGTESNLTFSGSSFICDPEGDVLYKASKDKEEVLVMEVDKSLSHNKYVTARNHVFDDRVPEQYR